MADQQKFRPSVLILAFLIASGQLAGAPAPQRRSLPLREGWLVKQLATDRPDIAALSRELVRPETGWLAAKMPAEVHEILLAHGRIPDPHVGKNAAESAWVGESDWAYGVRFKTPAPGGGPVFLRFEGLDTLAAVHLNGVEIGRFEDMFMEYARDIRTVLRPAGRENDLVIVFSSPLRAAEAAEKAGGGPRKEIGRSKFIRKSSGDFSSYLGSRPHAVKVGIYRDVLLDIPGPSWIEDVWTRSELQDGGRKAVVRADILTAGRPAPLRWSLKDPDGRSVASGESRAGTDHRLSIPVAVPRLWWPWTDGRPDLYTLEVECLAGGAVADAASRRVGIRDIKLVLKDPETGEPRFRFDINGRPVFLRGANWIPVEGMSHVWDAGRAKTLLDLAVHGGMNVLRVWGEGQIPPAEFFDECDRRGLLVWQDFMFGYGPYPTGIAGLDRLYREEGESMVRKLRSHPSILLWCGGNENHMGWDFARQKPPMPGLDLFDKVLPAICARLDPGRPYHPSSPWGGPTANWPLEGDWHDYTTLWFLPQASVPAFGSEVGRVSVSSLQSMKNHLSAEDLWPAGFDPRIRVPGQAAWPPMWQYRSVNGSWDKVGPIEQYADPDSAESLIRVLGTAHGEYLRQRVERERRGLPDGAPDGPRRCWGNIIWRLNDCWPIIYWSVIDYYLEPKLAYYYLRRAYDPVLISFERTPDKITAWVVNDSATPVSGPLTVKHMTFEGRVLAERTVSVSVGPGESKRCLDLSAFGPISLREEFLLAEFAGRSITELLHGEKYLHLPAATLTVRREGDAVVIASDKFVRQVLLTAEGGTGPAFEDNAFDMAPGTIRTVRVLNAGGARILTVKGLNAPAVSLELSSGGRRP